LRERCEIEELETDTLFMDTGGRQNRVRLIMQYTAYNADQGTPQPIPLGHVAR